MSFNNIDGLIKVCYFNEVECVILTMNHESEKKQEILSEMENFMALNRYKA